MKPQPFSRMRAFMAACNAIAWMPIVLRGEAFQKLGPYESRGKGRGSMGRNYIVSRSKYTPHQGKREIERRRKQIERGILTASA